MLKNHLDFVVLAGLVFLWVAMILPVVTQRLVVGLPLDTSAAMVKIDQTSSLRP